MGALNVAVSWRTGGWWGRALSVALRENRKRRLGILLRLLSPCRWMERGLSCLISPSNQSPAGQGLLCLFIFEMETGCSGCLWWLPLSSLLTGVFKAPGMGQVADTGPLSLGEQSIRCGGSGDTWAERGEGDSFVSSLDLVPASDSWI